MRTIKYIKILFVFLYLLLILGSTFSSKSFLEYNDLGNYLYVFISIIIFIFAIILKKELLSGWYFNKIIIVYGIFLIYLFFNSLFQSAISIRSFESIKALIYVFSFFHLILLYSFFHRDRLQKGNMISMFFYSFGFTAIFQSGYAYLQLAGLLNNPHSIFKMGGTIGNPNVLATFLSLILVYGFTYILFSTENKSKERYWLLTAFCFILPIILLSRCRTAWLSLLVGCNVSLFFRFRLWSYFRYKFTWICFIGAIGLFSFALSKLYTFKQESADGRLYIWRLTTEMIFEKPIFGYGFNQYEKEYNLYQANHFASLPEKEKNFNRSLYTETCYNDFMETTLESGIIGLILFILIFFYAFKYFFRNLKVEKCKEHNTAVSSSLIAFCLISLVNYNTVLPFSMLFFAFLLSVISLPEKKVYDIKGYKALGIAWCIGLGGWGMKEYDACKTQLELKILLEEKITKKEFLEESRIIEKKLYPSGVNMFTYASILSRYGLEEESVYELEEAKKVSSNYNIYNALGKRYAREKRFNEAIKHFEIATNMMPLLILPRYWLLKLYNQTGNIEAARTQATLILDIQPAKKSEDILNVKEKAKQYLDK